MPDPYLLLVDLGGVLLHHDPSRAWKRWAAESGTDPELLRQRWTADPSAYTAFEVGRLTPAEFLTRVRTQLRLDLDDQTLARGWNDVFTGTDTGLVRLLRHLDPGMFRPVGLSNTNTLHEQAWATRYRNDLAALRTVYCSHRIGAAKPDSRVFEYVAAAENITYDRMVLLDDQPVNVAAADLLGLHAHVYRDAGTTAAYLATFTART
jgi:FMN phosphatase YigB (HAD superfamily)